jgi:Ca-activated chloride channel family protein
MEGVKMVSAARACGLLLRTLGPRDRFAIAAFSDVVEWMGGAPSFSVSDEHGQEQGERWLREIEAHGGTELDSALGGALSALGMRKDATGRAAIVVLVTDGQIADEAGVLRRLQRELGAARVFCVGIDTAVNAGLLTRLASLGAGTSTFVEPGAQLEEALRSISREIGEPLLLDLSIEDVDAGLVASSIAPQRLPDLFAGRAAFAAFRVGSLGRIRVNAKWSDGRAYQETVEARPTPLAAVAQIWARARVADLEDRFRLGEQAAKQEIVALGLRYSLLTRFTAFVAVDGEVVNRGGVRRQVTQPVAMPAGWVHQAVGRAPMSVPLTGRGMLKALARAAPSPGMTAMGALSPKFSEMMRGVAEPGPAVYDESTAYEGGGEEDLEQALALLVAAMTDARAQLAAGRVPETDPLERARTAVLGALSLSPAGQRMPALQRFLRAGMVELIAALHSKATRLRDVLALFELRAKELEEAKREARGAMPLTSQAAFWEATI